MQVSKRCPVFVNTPEAEQYYASARTIGLWSYMAGVSVGISLETKFLLFPICSGTRPHCSALQPALPEFAATGKFVCLTLGATLQAGWITM